MIRRLSFLSLALSYCLFFACAAHSSENTEDHLVSFESAGKTIRAELFRPARGGTYPGVILLHGSGGMDEWGSGFLRKLATQLQRGGFVTAIVYYMDRDDLKSVERAQIEPHFKGWTSTISDGITWLQKQPGVKQDKIGIMGHSLGAHLALMEASDDKRVGAVVDMAGRLVAPLKPDTKMPPVLILHGGKDPVVLPASATELEAALKKNSVSHKKKIYAKEGHCLVGVLPDVMNRIESFFNAELAH
jgi:dienelactone hydrolase